MFGTKIETKIRVFSTVAAFVCQIETRILLISFGIISKTGRQTHCGKYGFVEVKTS